jgi:tetratricopeptide (TPR) repeat protein
LPSGLASFGSTASTISEHDALTGFPGKPVLESIASLSAGRFFDALGIGKSHSELPFAALGSRRSARYNTVFPIMTQAQKSRREALEQFVADKPTDAFARYGLALECVKLGDDSAATLHFQKLLETNPGYVAGYFQYGQLLSRMGRLDEARKMLSDGIVVAQRAGDMHARDEMQAALTLLR